jgi:hypothetical protein
MRETIIENPIWEQIETAIQALNNDDLNDLFLYTNDNSWLGVGGGAGQYFLSGAIGEDLFFTLVDPNKSPDREIFLTVGGQESEHPGNCIHGLAQALAAACDFFEAGDFISNFNWVKS